MEGYGAQQVFFYDPEFPPLVHELIDYLLDRGLGYWAVNGRVEIPFPSSEYAELVAQEIREACEDFTVSVEPSAQPGIKGDPSVFIPLSQCAA